ncbi:MAG: helix-turn-helix transcriptional regulator [Clostridia bacterium]|nr:helix-turn-helix transcriptional regulator [Clostridia bacterium]
MQFFPEIIPLFEARLYLNERFSGFRTSAIIKHFEPKKELMSFKKWTCFCRIAEIQRELDELIPADELMKRYFMPLKTKTDLPGDRSLTLGGLLLSLPPTLDCPIDYDDLVAYCANAPQQDLMDAYFFNSIAPFFKDKCEFDSVNMAKIVSSVNEILVDTEDKWAIIDCISNPCEHLERLRPLVIEVMKQIKEKSKEFSDFIVEEMQSLCGDSTFPAKLGEVIRREVKQKDVANAKVYTSLFSFNGVDMTYESDSFAFNRIIIGIYINTLIELIGKNNSPAPHLNMLKILSDPNRFNILHELCHRQSYGQELADKFGGARSAIYYHLEKLLGYGLIDLEMTEYRMLYTMNKQAVYDKMNAIRDYLLDGWKPGDTSAETEKTAEENPKINA